MRAPIFRRRSGGCCAVARSKASRCTNNQIHTKRRPETSMASARLPVFEKFIGDLRGIWAANPDDQSRMTKAKPVLEKFVMEPTLKAHSANWPSTEGHKNLLLYVDEEKGFVVNAV